MNCNLAYVRFSAQSLYSAMIIEGATLKIHLYRFVRQVYLFSYESSRWMRQLVPARGASALIVLGNVKC